MGFFELFLPALALLISVISLFVFYRIISTCKESAFIPTYYFIALGLVSVLGISSVKIYDLLFGFTLIDINLAKDLLISYTALFLFGALWQSYETSIVIPPTWIDQE